MPTIGGINAGWDNTTPADTENAGQGDDRIRSAKTSIQQVLDAEHNFPAAGGANTGYHVLGSARPYYGLQSAVSSSGSDGRLMQTSDTSRLFHVGSGGTSFIGGATALLAGTYPGAVPQRHYWAFEIDEVTTDTQTADNVVTFSNSGYSGVPYIILTSRTTASIRPVLVGWRNKSTTTVNVFTRTDSGTSATAVEVTCLSIGTRVL